MPGYILHLAEAKVITEELKKRNIPLDEKWINEFQLGCLLPDTKRKTEKITSHFWNPQDLVNLAIAPDLKLFMSRYEEKLQSPLMLGYFVHLFLDARFVESFWKTIMELRDEQGKTAVLRSEVSKVLIRNENLEVTAEVFFSGKFYYGDYSRMNAWVTKHYDIEFPMLVENLDCPVMEVAVSELESVLKELNQLRQEMKMGLEKDLRVFSLEQICGFVEDTAYESVEWLMKRLKK